MDLLEEFDRAEQLAAKLAAAEARVATLEHVGVIDAARRGPTIVGEWEIQGTRMRVVYEDSRFDIQVRARDGRWILYQSAKLAAAEARVAELERGAAGVGAGGGGTSERRHEWTDPKTGRAFNYAEGKVWELLSDKTPMPDEPHYEDPTPSSEMMTRYAAHLAAKLDAAEAWVAELERDLEAMQQDMEFYRGH